MVRVTELKDKYIEELFKVVSLHEGEQESKRLKEAFLAKTQFEEYLVCIDNESDEVIGYSKTTTLTHGILKLDYIYVIPTLRRDTNGSIILVAVYNRAVNRMTAGIIAECEKDNQEGNAFFKSRGFILGKEEAGINFYTKSLMHMYMPHKHDDKQ
ncbi:MAG: GNAT family N-acetyltransferase [Clostridia bacterium]|nr:GNAT family N-acetyltransferase [Clostridia bacterium]